MVTNLIPVVYRTLYDPMLTIKKTPKNRHKGHLLIFLLKNNGVLLYFLLFLSYTSRIPKFCLYWRQYD